MNKGAIKLAEWFRKRKQADKNYNQTAMGREIGVTQTHVGRLLGGTVPAGRMSAMKISKVFRNIKVTDWWEEV
jgi:hypothetical protein